MRFLSPSNSNMNGINGGDFYSPVEEEDEEDEETMDLQDAQRQRSHPTCPPMASPMVALQFEQAQHQQQLLMVRRQRMQELEAARDGGLGQGGFSGSRSLNLLLESEKVGIATREELMRQKEQLRATETRLDDINGVLKQSELRAEAIRNILTGIRAHIARGKQAHAAAQQQQQQQQQQYLMRMQQQQQQPSMAIRAPGQPQTVALRQQQLRQQQQQRYHRPGPPPFFRGPPPNTRPRMMSRNSMMPPVGGASSAPLNR